MIKTFVVSSVVCTSMFSLGSVPAQATDVNLVKDLIRVQGTYNVTVSEYNSVRSQMLSLGQQIKVQTTYIKSLRDRLAKVSGADLSASSSSSASSRSAKLQSKLGLKVAYRKQLRVRLAGVRDQLVQVEQRSSKQFRVVQRASGKVLDSVVLSDIPSVSNLKAGYSNPVPTAAAISTAMSSVGVVKDSGYCLRFVGNSFGRFEGPASAYMVYKYAPKKIKHPGDFAPPPGALVVWSSAIGRGHGHVGLSIGDGYMVSTTWGPISVLPIKGFSDSAYLGWIPPYFYK